MSACFGAESPSAPKGSTTINLGFWLPLLVVRPTATLQKASWSKRQIQVRLTYSLIFIKFGVGMFTPGVQQPPQPWTGQAIPRVFAVPKFEFPFKRLNASSPFTPGKSQGIVARL